MAVHSVEILSYISKVCNMKPFCLSVFLLGVIVPLNDGLRCYECISEKGLEDAPPYHEKCEEGALPSSHGVDCSVHNLRNPETLKRLKSEEMVLKQNHRNFTWMCSKQQGKFEGKDLTVKGCDIHPDSDGVDQCWDQRIDDGRIIKICNCFSDLCNGSDIPTKIPLMTIIISVIAFFY